MGDNYDEHNCKGLLLSITTSHRDNDISDEAGKFFYEFRQQSQQVFKFTPLQSYASFTNERNVCENFS